MTWLTSVSQRNCKNDRTSLLEKARRAWKNGKLYSDWTGETIAPNDQAKFDEYIRNEIARLSAPILLANMIQKVKKYAKMKVAIIWHHTGYTDAVRWAKNRLHHCNQISEFIRESPRYKDLFEGCRTVLELLGEHELNFSIGVPNSGSLTRPNGVEFQGDKTSFAGRAFAAYVEQAPIHCFNFLVSTLRNDPQMPWSEYLLPAMSGLATWSGICDLGIVNSTWKSKKLIKKALIPIKIGT